MERDEARTPQCSAARTFIFNDHDPPANLTVGVSPVPVMIGGPGNDTFVFKPGFGADIIANAISSDTIELDGFSSVTSIDELQTFEVRTGPVAVTVPGGERRPRHRGQSRQSRHHHSGECLGCRTARKHFVIHAPAIG